MATQLIFEAGKISQPSGTEQKGCECFSVKNSSNIRKGHKDFTIRKQGIRLHLSKLPSDWFTPQKSNVRVNRSSDQQKPEKITEHGSAIRGLEQHLNRKQTDQISDIGAQEDSLQQTCCFGFSHQSHTNDSQTFTKNNLSHLQQDTKCHNSNHRIPVTEFNSLIINKEKQNNSFTETNLKLRVQNNSFDVTFSTKKEPRKEAQRVRNSQKPPSSEAYRKDADSTESKSIKSKECSIFAHIMSTEELQMVAKKTQKRGSRKLSMNVSSNGAIKDTEKRAIFRNRSKDFRSSGNCSGQLQISMEKNIQQKIDHEFEDIRLPPINSSRAVRVK